MQFNRMTKEDIQNLSGFLLEKGTCSFVIKKAEEVSSKTGNPMMKVEMDVKDVNDKVSSVIDYIFYSDQAKWKLVSFCKGIGLEEKLYDGIIEVRDVLNKKGQLVIVHEEYNGEKKNKVQRYLPYLDQVMLQKKMEVDTFQDNDLPF